MNLPPVPPVASPVRRLARALRAPVERFLAVQASSGIVLLVAAVIALLAANSPLRAAVEALWALPVGADLGAVGFVRDLRWWVNDGLMAVFFFVVGMEIRREVQVGELSQLRRAALPLAAALGGMLLPALVYTAFNAGRPTAGGWGVPMATDIAFAVGVLALLGPRVPPALRILLLALAVLDDLGAIVVIALFYTDGVSFPMLALAALGLVAQPVLRRAGVRSAVPYVLAGLLAWGATYASGVHPTIAGVALGLLTANPHLEHRLHPWVAFGIMPLFALANAGVPLGAADLGGDGLRVFLGVAVGLVAGKALGVFALARAAVALGVAELPRGVRWRDVSVVGGVAGIGFTMALFIAQLAFPPGPALETARLAILAASATAGVAGWLAGRLLFPDAVPAAAAATEAAAESSTDA